MEPDEVRAALVAWRQGLERTEVDQASRRVSEQARRSLDPPATAAAYVGHHGEIDPRPLLEQWQLSTTEIGLPRVTGADLEFVRCYDQVERGAFGIPEPIGGTPLRLSEVDLVLVPLVAFDIAGNRLGYGRGFYDRALAAVSRAEDRPLLVGLAYDEQQVETITPHEWDVPLDVVVTPTRVIDARAAGSGSG